MLLDIHLQVVNFTTVHNFITAVCILVCVEIFHGTVEYEKNNLPAKYPAQAKHKFGFCFGLSWFCIAMLIISGVILFVYSRKQKDELVEDRPVIIGRI